MPSKPINVPSLDLATSNFNTGSKSPLSKSVDGLKPESHSPLTPRSPKSSPSSPFTKGSTIRPVAQRSRTESSLVSPTNSVGGENAEPPTPGITAIPQYPPSPKFSPKHSRDPSRSFFANLKASKSSHKFSTSDSSGVSGDNQPESRGSSKDRVYPTSRGNPSTPDLPSRAEQAKGDESWEDQNGHSRHEAKQQLDNEQSNATTSRKNKPRFAGLLSRTRSIRVDDSTGGGILSGRRPSNPMLLNLDHSKQKEVQEPLKTAPLRQDRLYSDATGSSIRNRSADRPVETRPQPNQPHLLRKERVQNSSMVTSSSFQGASAALFNNIKHSSTGAADRLGKAGKGFFGKITRSGSTNEREVMPDEIYTCSVINLPLVEQTRRTRISKRLEDCKDKTEFWMPALPYRCIDYLNFKGCEEEGLYRVPGSGKEVKHWQRRFDTELDINLFDEPDLYDINIIGSMFKAWLRELPDELLPKETQTMIAEKCEGATTAPQLLRDELSKLPPYNYYLLFAITCHLNLLHSYVDQNKMDYRNLCICFQPCMRIDAFCFNFLVCDWKNCWQGCWTEKEWLKAEREAAEKATNAKSQHSTGPPSSHGSASDGRALSSSGSSQPPRSKEGSRSRSRSPGGSRGRPRDVDTNHARSLSQLPELGPPLSPIKI